MPRTNLDRKDTLSKRLGELAQAQAATPNSPHELKKLEKQIKVAQRELCSLHNSDAPISTLPDEVLAMVFEEGMVLNSSEVLEGLSCHQAPMLRSIVLGIDRGYFEPRPVLNAHISPFEAPLLTTAHLSWIQASDLAFCLPAFENLTTLKLTHLYINDREEKECLSFRDTLMAMPRLYCLDLQLRMSVGSFGLSEVLLHTIEFLRIDACQGALEGVINSIHAKSLTTLYLVRRDDLGETRFAGEENWASHFPSLRHLILENGIQEPQDMDVISCRFPSIRRFTYGLPWGSETGHVDHVLDSICLAAKHDDNETDISMPRSDIGRPVIPWPKLDTIALSTLDDTDTSITMLYERISKLQSAGYHIRKLKLPERIFARVGEDIERLQSIVDLEEYSLDWPTTPYGRHSAAEC
ncbi:hypothetical protein HWV62_8323 [Athelia sp. TMB]|nr:hypothetical protein HWV62_8323 [Athelia sp. TMB]